VVDNATTEQRPVTARGDRGFDGGGGGRGIVGGGSKGGNRDS